MKALQIFILIFILSQITYGQINVQWEKVSTPDSSFRSFQYFSREGYLLYKDIAEQVFYGSFDSGNTWKKMILPTVASIGASDYSLGDNFREDNENNIYFLSSELKEIPNSGNHSVSHCLIYKIDKNTHEVSLFYNLGFANSIIDFYFLENGNVILTTRKKIILLDAVNIGIKKEKTLTISRGGIYVSHGFKKYVNIGESSSNVFQEIDDTLGFIGNKLNFPHYYNLKYSKGRFFNNGRYSDDAGQTWNKLKNFTATNFNIGHNDWLFGTDGTNSIYSTNNGDSTMVIENYDFSYISSDKRGTFYKTPTQCKNPRKEYISTDLGTTWKELRSNLNIKPFSISVIAGKNNDLISEDNCEKYLFYIKKSNKWYNNIERFNKAISLYNLRALPDGSYYFNNGFDNYIINEQIDNLKLCNYKMSYTYNNIFIKNDKLYWINSGNKLQISEDFINIKNTKTFYIQNSYNLYPTSKDKIIKKGSDGWSILSSNNIITESMPLLFDGKPINLEVVESSYNGTNIYGIELLREPNQYSTDLIFYKSIDEGQSFSKKVLLTNFNSNDFLKIIVDHNENVYILFRNKVLASFDEGENWNDITPKDSNLIRLTDISISYDNYIYLSTLGLGILKLNLPNAHDAAYIKVKAIRDENLNCISEINEVIPVYGILRSDNLYIKPLNDKGEALVYYLIDSTKISLKVNKKFTEVCQEEIILSNVDPDSTIIFNVKIYQECADLQLGLSTNTLRRCFENKYFGYIKNEGNETSENTRLTITLDTFFNFIATTLPVLSYNHPELTLEVPDLAPGENINFTIIFELNCEAELGQEHCISAFTEARNSCNIASRDYYTECRTNTGSYDPNDKAIFVSGVKDVKYFTKEDKIEYLVRFQNTGNDTAFNIRVEDIISPTFDINSIKPTVASHEFDWEIKPERKLVVFFKNILLVDSFTNEPLSNGFVKFEMKVDSNLQSGDTIFNEASIYFDFNDPIITNKVETIYSLPNKTDNTFFYGKIFAAPNPTISQIEIKGNLPVNEKCIVNVFNLEGRNVFSQNCSTSKVSLDITNLPPSIYIIQIITDNNKYNCRVSKL